jgi:hypothetical protein
VRFTAICDVKAERREAVKKRADEKYGNNDCVMYRDLRELLSRKDIDAVLIATGPNWHCTAALLSANAGKDGYCEKPCTKNIMQSLALAETFRRTGRVFQAGTQRRSLPNFLFAIDLARRGKLGKLQTLYAHPAGLKTMTSGWLEAQPEPDKEKVDWDLYLGQRRIGLSTKRSWMVSISKKVEGWSEVAVSSGVLIAWISANGPMTPMTLRQSSMNRKTNNCMPLRKRGETYRPGRWLA